MKKLMQKFILTTIFITLSLLTFSQAECGIENSKNYKDLPLVTVEKIKCIAKNNEGKSLFYTFAAWCKPCRQHADGAFQFAKEHNLNFYFVLLDNDKENNQYIIRSIDFLKKINENANILLVSNDYGSRINKKNKNFVKEITPPEFENIDCWSKYILIDEEGKVLMVTNYKDAENDDWRDDSGTRERKLLPLLK